MTGIDLFSPPPPPPPFSLSHWQDGDTLLGHDVGAWTSIALATAMGSRALRTRKLYPAGAVAALGVAGGIYHGWKALQWREYV